MPSGARGYVFRNESLSAQGANRPIEGVRQNAYRDFISAIQGWAPDSI